MIAIYLILAFVFLFGFLLLWVWPMSCNSNSDGKPCTARAKGLLGSCEDRDHNSQKHQAVWEMFFPGRRCPSRWLADNTPALGTTNYFPAPVPGSGRLAAYLLIVTVAAGVLLAGVVVLALTA